MAEKPCESWPVLGMVQHPESCVHVQQLVSWPHGHKALANAGTEYGVLHYVLQCIVSRPLSMVLDHPCKREPSLLWNIDSIQAASAKTILLRRLVPDLAGTFCARLGPHRRARYTPATLFSLTRHRIVHEKTALVASGTREYQRRKSLISSRPITTPGCGSYTARRAAKPSDMFHEQRLSKLLEAPFQPTFDGCFPPILFIWP